MAKSKDKPKPNHEEVQSEDGGKQKSPRLEGYESIENIKKMFDDALSGDDEEIAEIAFDEAESEPEAPVVNREGLKRKLLYGLGVFVIVFTVIGVISTAGFLSDSIKAFADNTKEKHGFAKFIYPIVICDPAPFDQTVKLRNDTMITAAIWDIILYADKSKYADEFDYIIVPELDVERHAIGLFGQGLNFKHETINFGAEFQFFYEEEIKSYYIPSNPKYFTYSPYIHDISRVGERYTLTVGYLPPAPAWQAFSDEEDPVPEKYVEYIVSKRGNEYTLIAIRESSLNEQGM